jgi:hypothetical protein
MPLYYFHLYDGGEWVSDAEGIELADRAAIEAVALSQARDVMAGDIREGRIDLNLRIVIDDAAGERAHMLCFADALTIAPISDGDAPAGPGLMRVPPRAADPTR